MGLAHILTFKAIIRDNGRMNKRYSLAAVASITALISFAVYLPALDNGFVNWDDPVYFFDNPHIRDFGWDFF